MLSAVVLITLGILSVVTLVALVCSVVSCSVVGGASLVAVSSVKRSAGTSVLWSDPAEQSSDRMTTNRGVSINVNLAYPREQTPISC